MKYFICIIASVIISQIINWYLFRNKVKEIRCIYNAAFTDTEKMIKEFRNERITNIQT